MNARTRTRTHKPTTRPTARLARRLAAASVVAATMFGLAAGPASADFGANVATIKQTGFQAYGTYAHMQWTADVPSTVIEVSTATPQQVNGKWQFPGPAMKQTVPKSGGAFEYYALALKPATKYHVILTAPANGNKGSAQAKGEFTTKARVQLLTTFDSIHVIDDGDGGTKGAGDLWWHFDTSYSSWSDGWHKSASSGDTFAVNPDGEGSYVAGALYLNNPSSVTVTLQGIEDDVWGIGDWSCGLFGQYSGEPDTWSGDCSEGAFAQTVVQLPTYVFEGNAIPFTASTPTSRVPMQFSVSGTVQAIYG
ncbi:MAG: hypothetical protein QOH36_712 [Actinomycetota bacterium]|nr:hypothetical protein [Actinomycetota bacterium]